MYAAVILATMVALPAIAIAVELLVAAPADPVATMLKWAVFWLSGVRLAMAGVSQLRNPGFTARRLLGVEAPGTAVLVRELGFSNLAFGAVSLASLLLPEWRAPAAFATGLFFLFAGLGHVAHGGRGASENLAMVSDFWAAAVLLGLLGAQL